MPFVQLPESPDRAAAEHAKIADFGNQTLIHSMPHEPVEAARLGRLKPPSPARVAR
jgi:hypothetical protein